MSTFSKGQSKDYIKKRNVKNNNYRDDNPWKHTRLYDGGGVLPKSRKYKEKKV
ncbi:MAG: hypothetical protein PHC53_02570 [Patescibacteria group bacterium]|nr:hypothetical protein [Patescibacteria group bacterium]